MTSQQSVLECIKAHPGIDRYAIAAELGASKDNVKGCVYSLVERGCARQSGYGRDAAYYYVRDLPASYRIYRASQTPLVVDDVPRTAREIMERSAERTSYDAVVTSLRKRVHSGELVVDRSADPYTYRLRREGEPPSRQEAMRAPVDSAPRTVRELSEMAGWTPDCTQRVLARMERGGTALCDRSSKPYRWRAPRADEMPLAQYMTRAPTKASEIAGLAGMIVARATAMLRAMEREGIAVADRTTDEVALWRLAR